MKNGCRERKRRVGDIDVPIRLSKAIARRMRIEFWENALLVAYPMVKCNVSHRDGIKICHLLLDQYYDGSTIDAERH